MYHRRTFQGGLAWVLLLAAALFSQACTVSDSAVYAAKGEGNAEEGWIISVYYHPLVIWIWIGALMMAIGGLAAVADRRHAFARRPSPTAQPAAAE